MKILVGRTAGFCMGVRRAVEMVLDAPGEHDGPIYTYGPLIHNPQVLEILEDKGISVLSKIPEKGRGTVLIRAHGVPPDARRRFEAAGFTVIDATCPRVIKVQRIIERHAAQGYRVIIVGDRDHPEVIGLLGYAGDRGHVAGTLEELESLPPSERAIIVAQTTQNTRFYGEVKAWAERERPHYRIFETICDSTGKRQAEVKELADRVDAVVVVGGRTSGNTRRLAQIARESGRPAYHVETDADLDFRPLSSARRIGITAGASTPNWVIRRIYRSLETLPMRRSRGLIRVGLILQRTLLLTNVYVSLGAGCLCYACLRLQALPRYYAYILIAVLYVQSMHILNHLTGREEDRYNDPDRARFYTRYKVALGVMASIAGAAGLLRAYLMGWKPFLTLTAMSLMGLSYNLRIIPGAGIGRRLRRIRDIPGSKTILIAMAWCVVTAIFPSLAMRGIFDSTTAVVALWSLGLVFVRTAFFDILDMQGDRIVGKETIPILLGEKRSLRLLKGILAGITLILVSAAAVGAVAPVGFPLALPSIGLYLLLTAHQKGRMLPGIRLEFWVESHLVLAGIITLLWASLR